MTTIKDAHFTELPIISSLNISSQGIRHPCIYPKKGPGIPHIREAEASQTTRLNILLNMLMDHPNESNKDGKRVKFDPMISEHSNEIMPTRRQIRKREY